MLTDTAMVRLVVDEHHRDLHRLVALARVRRRLRRRRTIPMDVAR